MGQLEIFPEREFYDPDYKNPMVAQFGKGPEGRTCAHCKHLYVKAHDWRQSKCGLSRDTVGAAHHQVGFAACRFFYGAPNCGQPHQTFVLREGSENYEIERNK